MLLVASHGNYRRLGSTPVRDDSWIVAAVLSLTVRYCIFIACILLLQVLPLQL